MGYPMTYDRVVNRNDLVGPGYDYISSEPDLTVRRLRSLISGDMRRLEKDSRDERHLALYAKVANTTPEVVKAVLDAFFCDGGRGYGQP